MMYDKECDVIIGVIRSKTDQARGGGEGGCRMTEIVLSRVKKTEMSFLASRSRTGVTKDR